MLRKDPITNRWVIVAKNRAARPQAFERNTRVEVTDQFCPFCEGHEHETPGEVAAIRQPGTAPDSPGWRVRVFPNKYPAVEPARDGIHESTGSYTSMPSWGYHEVIVESPDHLLTTSDLSAQHLADVLGIYRGRLLDLARDKRLVSALIFKNMGAAAGASLEHTHSQLVALPTVPALLAEELRGSQRLFGEHGRCAYCDLIQSELALGERMVLDAEGFVAFCPYAACFPYETWILPKAHGSHFEQLSPHDLLPLARMFKQVAEKIERTVDRAAYNYIIHTAPFDTFALDHYHWHIEIIPRLTTIAGFEWGSGCFINPVPPEEAAAALRDCEIFS